MLQRRGETPLRHQFHKQIFYTIVSISLGMIDVTFLPYVNPRSEKLNARPPSKRLMDAYDRTPRIVGWLHVSHV